MKKEIVESLTDNFEAHAQQTEGGVEFWLGRDIQHLLGYSKWDNFLNVVSKAKTACEVSGHAVTDHFADVGKTIAMPKGAEKEVPDIMLTRYA
jgi:DNA-damage-inducible protein D